MDDDVEIKTTRARNAELKKCIASEMAAKVKSRKALKRLVCRSRARRSSPHSSLLWFHMCSLASRGLFAFARSLIARSLSSFARCRMALSVRSRPRA